MATQSQKNAARRLHELNDGSEITSTYGEGGYAIAHTDPYELSAIITAGGVLSVPVTVTAVVATNDTDITIDGGTSASTILITYSDASTSTDVTLAVWAGVSDTSDSTLNTANGEVTGNSTNGTIVFNATVGGITSADIDVVLTNQA